MKEIKFYKAGFFFLISLGFIQNSLTWFHLESPQHSSESRWGIPPGTLKPRTKKWVTSVFSTIVQQKQDTVWKRESLNRTTISYQLHGLVLMMKKKLFFNLECLIFFLYFNYTHTQTHTCAYRLSQQSMQELMSFVFASISNTCTWVAACCSRGKDKGEYVQSVPNP